MDLNTLLVQADSLRFKLLGIIGRNEVKKQKIIEYLTTSGWYLVDVESNLLSVRTKLDAGGTDDTFELGGKIKEWFKTQRANLILTNAGILYHDMFLKISPVGAFKYNSRNKNCVLFLEDESRLGKRIYHGQMGAEDYYDQEINDIILVDIEDIADDFTSKPKIREAITDFNKLETNAIGRLFNFQQIKDVIDIDADLDDSDKRAELVKSYVISESLEMQIADFFDNLEKPNHKACTVIGNYGSGKSHLVGLLVSLVEEPVLSKYVKSQKIRTAVEKFNRKFYSVQFELQGGQVELKQWFFGKIRQQLKAKYQVDIPVFDPMKDFDDKENMRLILEIVKKKEPSIGLLVIIDEISDFLATKQKEAMKADLQFLRVIGQVCQDQDLMFVGSMQEDVFTSSKFKDVASEIGRIGERFYNIIIHKEDIKKVIANRIVPKTNEQRHSLETKLSPFAEKIEPVSRNVDEYIDLFPLSPFLLELFSELPYFEKRGVIQFAITEIKYLLNEPFPYFITFEKIYDVLANNPNKRNIEEIYEVTKVMAILNQKVNLLEKKFQNDAIRIIKGLAVYSLWDRREKGSTAQELANNLMLLPEKKLFSAADNISLIIKKIRDVTEGEYIKTSKDESTGLEYFRFMTKAGVDPEQKIAQKAANVSNSEIEHELFHQLAEILELERFNGYSDIFTDECEWKSVKSFRRGYIIFVKEKSQFPALPDRDYAIVFMSPFVKQFDKRFASNQLGIKLKISVAENIELIKEIVAIKALINSNFQKQVMVRKLEGRINGYNVGQTTITGLKYRLVKILMNRAECDFNGAPQSIKSHIGRERGSVLEIVDELKTAVFDNPFNKAYPLHPKYPIQLSSVNISSSLTAIASDLTRGDFTNLSRNTISFLRSTKLLDQQEYPDISQSKIAVTILDKIKANKNKVTDIQKELVEPLCASQYGLEPEVVHFVLIAMTVIGKIFLQAKGGDRIDINNIKDKFKNLASFETISYAKVQEDYSYDFAARLLNSLGLNGGKITLEKERLNAFKEYKEKINKILQDIQSLEDVIKQLRHKSTLYIDLSAVQKDFDTIQIIDWKGLNITNHTQFGTLESTYNPLLPKITIALREIKEISDAIDEYEKDIHNAIGYMNQAIDLMDAQGILVTDGKKYSAIRDFRDEVLLICSDFKMFKDRSQRNPVKGKIQQFKKSYIFDFYFTAHEKYVGKKADWSMLNSYQSHPTFQRLKLLNDVTCISDTQFKKLVLKWNELATYKCINKDLEDQLQTNVRCNKCLFPVQDVKYNTILSEIANIESSLDDLLKNYEKNIIREIREYRDNIQFMDKDSEKELIKSILDTNKMPESLSTQDIRTINKLFKEIDIVEIDSNFVIKTLFPSQEMTTLEEFRKRFFALEYEIKKNKQESEVRIKLK